MKKGFNKVLASLLTSGVLVSTLALSLTGGQVSASTVASSPAAPAAYSWNNPINASQGGAFYDNTPSIAADQTDNTVSLGWTRTQKGGTDAYITQASNDVLGGSFRRADLWEGEDQQMGNVKLASDDLGRRHMAWWAVDGNQVIGLVSIIDANGNASEAEEVPGTRGANRKNVAIATGPDNSTHVLFGRNNENIYYYHRTPQGVWDVVGESVPIRSRPVDIEVGVSSQGVVMVAFKDTALGSFNDIWTSIRQGADSWTPIENPTAPCCNGCPFDSHTYQPTLDRDENGGLHMAWADERCDPVSDPPSRDIYYRQWTPPSDPSKSGWDNHPIVRVVINSGDSYYPDLAIDRAGNAHIVWGDKTSSPIDYYRMFYAVGKGTSFSGVQLPADPYFGRSYQKEPTVDDGPGYIHTAFASDRGDSQKENYYQFSPIDGGGGPAPTPTPAPQPPPCPNNPFKDLCVDGDQSSYDAVLELSEQGVLSGYSSSPPCPNASWINCFLPGNLITRQQLAKVIALGATVPANLQGSPHFTDVAPGTAFYEYVEYAYNAGALSGYTCGGPGEPCDGQRRAYFRPLANVTRGQISKMVAEAFDFNEPIEGQTFQDVAPNSPFYLYVERLARRGVIGGYPCGGANEPCGTSGKPYFRPNGNVTRRQAAKIVYGAQQQTEATATPTSIPATATTAATSTRTATATSTSIIPLKTTDRGNQMAAAIYNQAATPSLLRRDS
ncbi:MAG: S-layer homology domain-containing protein [Chloroflexota bacterium]|nr:S-layer homology domain-containing protein [Chloroflexota bacterium]